MKTDIRFLHFKYNKCIDNNVYINFFKYIHTKTLKHKKLTTKMCKKKIDLNCLIFLVKKIFNEKKNYYFFKKGLN